MAGLTWSVSPHYPLVPGPLLVPVPQMQEVGSETRLALWSDGFALSGRLHGFLGLVASNDSQFSLQNPPSYLLSPVTSGVFFSRDPLSEQDSRIWSP